VNVDDCVAEDVGWDLHSTTTTTRMLPFSTEEYFSSQHAPAGLDSKTAAVAEFVGRHKGRVVLVTVSDDASIIG
jgi:hypothetical protein